MVTILLGNNTNLSYVNETRKSVCLYLDEDGSSVVYTVDGNEGPTYEFGDKDCGIIYGETDLGSGSANITITTTSILQIQNENLHQWRHNSDGDLGLGYTFNSIGTSFQALLRSNIINTNENNSTEIFGLDFNALPETSTMQLGYVKDIYVNSFVWQQQPTQYPQYHEFIINNLELCGQNVISKWSNNWNTIVDTGYVCMSLPGEVYDNVLAYINTTGFISTSSDLPAFSFNMHGSDVIHTVPLSSLLLDVDDFENESGAPFITINNVEKRLCILRGSNIYNSVSGQYNYPFIVLGTLALRSLYFAADFSTYSVGLAPKYNSTTIQTVSSTSTCQARLLCIGQQEYDEYSNSCKSPPCSDYFYVYIDEDTQTCRYKSSAVTYGLLFVMFVVVLEIVSFFGLQYTAYNEYGSSNRLPGANIEYGSNTSPYKVDPITVFLGNICVKLTDLVVYFLCISTNPNNNEHNNV
jgi:hypothetical protein